MKITGPSHNFLGLQFSKDGELCQQTTIDLRSCDQSDLDLTELIRNVNQGVSEANRDFGVNYFVQLIQYVGDDTADEGRYSELAYKIVERLANGETFEA